MNEWNKLSMADRAAYIKLGINNGITDLATIRDTYNKYAEGGSTKWTMLDEANYLSWKDKLPDNLKYTNENDYDLRGAYKTGMEPQWNNKDKSYHLGSRDPYSGRILKSPHHPTYLKALITDASIGYYPSIDNKGNTYTNTWKGNKFDEGGYVREKNDNPIAFDEEGNLVDLITGEKGTMMLPEFTVRGVSPETKAKNYSSAYHPEDALEFFDIMTRPITAPITPSTLIGAIRNALNGGSYYKSLMGIEPNLGITTENFNKEHPYLSMGANLTFDMLSPFGLKGVNRGVNAASTFVGKKYITPYTASKIMNKAISANPKGQILVSDSYFNSPNNWYRISNTPEVYGIKEIGKNVTTRDSEVLMDVLSDNWRTSVLDLPLIRDVSSPDYLALDFIKRNRSPYSIDMANHMYGLDESLNFVDYGAMNDYGRVFNERIKKTLPLAKQRGTLRTNKNPTIIVADSLGRLFLLNRFFEELNKVNGLHFGDPITPTGILAKKYYYTTSPARNVFEIEPGSFADRKNNTIVLVPRNGDYKNMYKYTLPHEKTHIFIDGKKEAALFGDDRGFGARPRDGGYTDIDLDLYLARPDEQLARGTQIKNYLGIVDESPITPEQLKYAAQNYVKDTGYNNNMTDFFSSIKDYKKAAKWLSLAPSVSFIINNKYEEGGPKDTYFGLTTEDWKDVGLGMLPVVGTVRDALTFWEEPSLINGIGLGVSAATDIATLFGIGAAAKGAKTLYKAYKTKEALSNARRIAAKQATNKYKLTRMDRVLGNATNKEVKSSILSMIAKQLNAELAKLKAEFANALFWNYTKAEMKNKGKLIFSPLAPDTFINIGLNWGNSNM